MKRLSEIEHLAFDLRNRKFEERIFVGTRFESYGIAGTVLAVRVAVDQEARMMPNFVRSAADAKNIITGILFGVEFDEDLPIFLSSQQLNLSAFPHSRPKTSWKGNKRKAIISWPYLIDLNADQLEALKKSPRINREKRPSNTASSKSNRQTFVNPDDILCADPDDVSVKDYFEEYEDWANYYIDSEGE